MNLSKNVIRDLLPVYVAGEASEETRVLVEAALATHPDLRAEATTLGTVPESAGQPPATLGLDTLKRTQELLRHRTLLVGLSVFLSTLPLAMTGRPWGLAGRLGETVCLLAAGAGWVLFLKNAARLHAAGLDGPRSLRPHYAWYFTTVVFVASLLFIIWDWTGLDFSRWAVLIVMLAWAPVGWLGRRLRQLPEVSELQKPESIKAG